MFAGLLGAHLPVQFEQLLRGKSHVLLDGLDLVVSEECRHLGLERFPER